MNVNVVEIVCTAQKRGENFGMSASCFICKDVASFCFSAMMEFESRYSRTDGRSYQKSSRLSVGRWRRMVRDQELGMRICVHWPGNGAALQGSCFARSGIGGRRALLAGLQGCEGGADVPAGCA